MIEVKFKFRKMKTLKSLTLAIALIGFGISTASAGIKVEKKESTSTTKVGILPNSVQDRVVVSFNHEDADTYEVSIQDANGNTIHSEEVSEPGVFNKRYDFAELADGEYTIKVSSGSEVKSLETIYKN